MAKNTAAGTKLYIGAAYTDDAAMQTDMTYERVGQITNLGEFGKQYQEIIFNSIDERATEKFKGTFDNGNLPLQLGADEDDDGQTDLLAVADSDAAYNFKIELNDKPLPAMSKPTTFYFAGRVMSAKTNVGGPNQIVGLNAQISITGTIVKVAKVVGA